MTTYQPTRYSVPMSIRKLPGITLHYLDVYNVLCGFWDSELDCFISNKVIMERTGISSERTVQEAFVFFEKHKQLVRETISGKRYLTRPAKRLVDNSEDKDAHPPQPSAPPPAAQCAPPRTPLRDNKATINKAIINKSISNFLTDDQKQTNSAKSDNEIKPATSYEKPRPRTYTAPPEMKQSAKEWGAGHKDYDRLQSEGYFRRKAGTELTKVT